MFACMAIKYIIVLFVETPQKKIENDEILFML